MNLSKTFAFDEAVVRVAGTPEKPLFVAADVCRALGIEQASRAVEGFSETEKGVKQIHTPGGPQEMLVVTETGLYRLIFRSDKPAARKFQDWVFGEVLPDIRRSGSYGADRNEQLWSAFEKAKTGKVQLLLLAAMGFPADPPAVLTAPREAAVLACDPQTVWADIFAGLTAGQIRRELFRVRVAPGGCRLFVNFELLEELTRYNYAVYSRVLLSDLKLAFQTMPEWVQGRHVQRMWLRRKSESAPCSVWCFQVTANSVLLSDICNHLAGLNGGGAAK